MDSFPTHTISLSPMPAKVEKRLYTIRSEFLWRRNKEKKASHLGNWRIVKLNKKQGGMGVRNLKYQKGAYSSNGYGDSIKMKERYEKWWLPKSTEESITGVPKLITQHMGSVFGNI